MYFGSVRLGKAYVSFHLVPLYMCPPLTQRIPPALKKRMQGKACFNFKSVPEPELLAGLQQLTAAGIQAVGREEVAVSTPTSPGTAPGMCSLARER